MPDATELVSLTTLKEFLNVSGSTLDTKLQRVKDEVEQWVKTYCGRDLLVASYTEYYAGDGTRCLVLDQRPIVSVTSINVDPARLFGDSTLVANLNSGSPAQLISTALELRAGIVRLYSYVFTRGPNGVKVVYSAGLSTVPYDLQRAVKLIAAKQWKMQDLQMAGQVSQQVGDKTVTFSPDRWPQDALDILDKYKRVLA